MKLKYIPQYRIPENMDAIIVPIVIPRKILVEALPNFTYRDPVPMETMIKILENSEYEAYPVENLW